jgi:hypothetical protein
MSGTSDPWPTASVQYHDDETQAMARAAATLLAHWGVPHETSRPTLFLTAQAVTGLSEQPRCSAFTPHCGGSSPDGERAARWVGAAERCIRQVAARSTSCRPMALPA